MLAVDEAATIGTLAVSPIVRPPTITTLYALIATFQDQVAPEDDAAVTAAVVRLCHAGYVKFLNVSEEREMACTHESRVVPCRSIQWGTRPKSPPRAAEIRHHVTPLLDKSSGSRRT